MLRRKLSDIGLKYVVQSSTVPRGLDRDVIKVCRCLAVTETDLGRLVRSWVPLSLAYLCLSWWAG